MNTTNFLCKAGLAALCCIVVQACGTTEPTTTNSNPGTVVLEFDNVAGPRDLTLNAGVITNQHNETFTVSTCKYFISNIQLITESGTTVTLPVDENYFLIDEAIPASQKITIPKFPAGTYKEVVFILGVDSAKSVAPLEERTGALDPSATAEGMYWTWNSGYIFYMMEGTSEGKKIAYHIGGFGGLNTPTVNNIRKVTLPLSNIRVDSEHEPEIHIVADVTKLFGTPNPFTIADHPTVMLSDFSMQVSANYSTMFEVDHVHSNEHAH